MTWRVFVRAAAEADFENLDPADQQAVSGELFAWTDQGPPRQTRRNVLGVEMFDDVVGGLYRIGYQVDEAQHNILSCRSGNVVPTDSPGPDHPDRRTSSPREMAGASGHQRSHAPHEAGEARDVLRDGPM
ncbi:MAG: hypothetical protein ACRD0D_13565 [Acidimicrobiales bacterium]